MREREQFMSEEVLLKSRHAVVGLIALILSIAVHEFSHAWVADRLGDRTPRLQGRVTLNPMAHADPFGTLLFPLMGIMFFGGILFGWGRPVEVNPVSFTRKLRMKISHLLVAAAGPISNLLFGILISGVLLILLRSGVELKAEVHYGIRSLIGLNFLLCVFNLLPIPPLDGGTVLRGLLPDAPTRGRWSGVGSARMNFAIRANSVMDVLDRYGMWILIGLMATNGSTGILSKILWPATAFTLSWFRLLGI
jgi:Zn-dependent protease